MLGWLQINFNVEALRFISSNTSLYTLLQQAAQHLLLHSTFRYQIGGNVQKRQYYPEGNQLRIETITDDKSQQAARSCEITARVCRYKLVHTGYPFGPDASNKTEQCYDNTNEHKYPYYIIRHTNTFENWLDGEKKDKRTIRQRFQTIIFSQFLHF